MNVSILPESPESREAAMLMGELSAILESITGDSGQSSFSNEDVANNRSVFLIARDQRNSPVGCGAIRPLDDHCGEIKRMYSKLPGLGSRILTCLEERAGTLGYRILRLETRKINERAVSFYLRNGYDIIENYGKYRGNEKAVCFEKKLVG